MQERLFHGIGAGDDLAVVDTPVGRVGGLICWENRMPLARYAIYKGAPQIYVAPDRRRLGRLAGHRPPHRDRVRRGLGIWRRVTRDSTTVPNGCCNRTVNSVNSLTFWADQGDSVAFGVYFRAGVPRADTGAVHGDTLRINLFNSPFAGAFSGLHLYRRDP